ncbi:hypothetical protein K458DRAFT_154052 [Lentithecium fluviatile CBS 122367]|uniref:Uncharacterized protein n=1 Tax=Lentithecium fluviatile CBS 122367 TaxID=1168545 RepID=A0A6G1JEF5_9PLEO|nr:hypothetical protein K458DRAFT_154052 [Lentithecium fluviatile CBS 122367]
MQLDNSRINRRLEDVKKQLRKLHYIQRELQEEQDCLIEGDDLSDTIKTYSQVATFDIAERMQTKLPRELRDIITRQVWDPSLQGHLRPTLYEDDLARIFRTKCPGRPCECLRDVKNLNPWLNPACVGPAAALESAEMVYRLIVGMYADSPEMINYQLYADPFHVGFTPLPVIDNFTIEINIDYHFRKQRRSREAAHKNKDKEAYSFLDTLAEAVENLLKIPKKRGFTLDITLEQRYIRPNVLTEVLKVLKPAIEEFDKEEADIDMRFVYHNEKGTRDPKQAKFVWDLSDVYERSDEDWQAELSAALDLTPWVLKRHRTYSGGDRIGFNPRTDCDKRDSREVWADVEAGLEDDEEDPRWTKEAAMLVKTAVKPKVRRSSRRKY